METKRVWQLEVGKCYRQKGMSGELGRGIFTITEPIRRGRGLHRINMILENYTSAKQETEEVVTSEYSEFVEI